MIAVGVLLALASAVALNVGYYRQHSATREMPPLTLRRPVHSLALLLHNPGWLAGLATGLAGWGLYVVAVAIAPLSIVQAASAGGIGVLAALSWRGRPSRPAGEVIGVALATGGLVLLGLSLVGTRRDGVATVSWHGVALWELLSLAVAVALARWGLAGVGRGAALGVAAGVLYGAGDTATKAALPGSGHLAFVPVVLAAHGLAFVAIQLGFQRGRPLATAGTATLLTNSLPIVAGVALFHEGVGHGVSGAIRLLSFALVVGGAAALALSQASGAHAEEAGCASVEPSLSVSAPGRT